MATIMVFHRVAIVNILPSHCPWVDTCVGVNNHKHFLLYVMSLIVGIACLIRLTFVCTSCAINY